MSGGRWWGRALLVIAFLLSKGIHLAEVGAFADHRREESRLMLVLALQSADGLGVQALDGVLVRVVPPLGSR